MRYIKKYEVNFYGIDKDIRDRDQIYIPNIFEYLDIDSFNADFYYDNGLETKYDVNVKDYFNEIFLNKSVTFKNINSEKNNPIITGIVNNIDFAYYNEICLKFYIDSKNIWHKGWWTVSNENYVSVPEYDANTKPLHKKVEMLKNAEQFNL